MQVSKKIIDFHLVEKCRTKFRAFVKSYGAKVKFEPVRGVPRKQEYHGTVTVNRACKQQWLTQNGHSGNAIVSSLSNPGRRHSIVPSERQLQCAAPTPITTGMWPSSAYRCSTLCPPLPPGPRCKVLLPACGNSLSSSMYASAASAMSLRCSLRCSAPAGAHHTPYFEDGNDTLSRSLLHYSLSIPNESTFGHESCRVSSGSGACPPPAHACWLMCGIQSFASCVWIASCVL